MKVGIIGAGTMGQGIAKAFAQVDGYEVALCDIKQEWAEGGKAKIAKGYDRLVQKERRQTHTQRSNQQNGFLDPRILIYSRNGTEQNSEDKSHRYAHQSQQYGIRESLRKNGRHTSVRLITSSEFRQLET